MDEKQLKVETQFINSVVAIILATGMYVTVTLYLVGLVLMFAEGTGVPRMSDQYFHSFGTFFSSLFSLRASAFLYLGTITLILTPVSRVLISIFAFWKEKDFKYVGITAVVFMVIMISVLVGSVFKLNVG
jgi:uncharacterized membrane protein